MAVGQLVGHIANVVGDDHRGGQTIERILAGGSDRHLLRELFDALHGRQSTLWVVKLGLTHGRVRETAVAARRVGGGRTGGIRASVAASSAPATAMPAAARKAAE